MKITVIVKYCYTVYILTALKPDGDIYTEISKLVCLFEEDRK